MAISVEEFKNKAIRDVEITGFDEGETIALKLRSLSLLGLASSGKIPNELMGVAIEMFEGKDTGHKDKKEDSKEMLNITKLMDVICDNALIEPKYSDIGEYLTDDQKMEIFYYTQGGIRALKSFRSEQSNTVVIDDSKSIQNKTESAIGNK